MTNTPVNQFGIPITSTLRLDHCWVCARSLPGRTPREEHHPLPQHAVGSSKLNPTVTICLDCHELIHDAIRKTRKNPHAINDFLLPGRDCRNARFVWLVQVAQRAEALTANDPNKRFVFTSWMAGATHLKMVQLQRAWDVKSQEKLIELLIDLAHRQHFATGLKQHPRQAVHITPKVHINNKR